MSSHAVQASLMSSSSEHAFPMDNRADALGQFADSFGTDVRRKMEFKRVRRKFLGEFIEMILFVGFLILFTFVLLGGRDEIYSYRYNELMKDLFLNEEFPTLDVLKNFYAVKKIDEFWMFMTDVLLPQAFKDQGGFGPPRYIYGQNALIGVIRLRQVRVREGDCGNAVAHVFKSAFLEGEACYPRYSYHRTDKTTYGPNGEFVYVSAKAANSLPLTEGYLVTKYDGGGFIEDFSYLDQLPAHLLHMQRLRNSSWVDLATRVVFINLATYNANVNLFQTAQITFEFLPSGGIYPYSKFRTMRLLRYNQSKVSGRQQLGLEIVLLLLIFFYILEELYEMYTTGLEYLRGFWNYVDWINIALFGSAVGIRVHSLSLVSDLALRSAGGRDFLNFERVAYFTNVELVLVSVNTFILFFKIFKYTSFVPSMAMIKRAMALAAKNAIGFVIIMIMILVGFATAANVAFGVDVVSYRSFEQSFFTLFLLILGEFDFPSLKVTNRTFGPFFFVVFVFALNFNLLQLFLAIINDSLQVAQREAAADTHETVFSAMRHYIRTKCEEIGLIPDQARAETERQLFDADTDDNDVLSIEEVERIFHRYEEQAKRNLGVSSASEFLQYFDFDGDSVLSADEQTKLLDAIHRWNVEATSQKDKLAPGTLIDPSDEDEEPEKRFRRFVVALKTDLFQEAERLKALQAKIAQTAAAQGLTPEDKEVDARALKIKHRMARTILEAEIAKKHGER